MSGCWSISVHFLIMTNQMRKWSVGVTGLMFSTRLYCTASFQCQFLSRVVATIVCLKKKSSDRSFVMMK